MPYPWIKAIHYIGLALLLGGPVFWHFIREGDADQRPGPRSAAGWVVFALGLVLFLVSGYLDAVRAARDLWGELLPGDMQYFLTQSRYGVIITRKSVLAVLFAALAVVAARRPRAPWMRAAVAALGLGVVYHVSAASHSAAEGFLGLFSDMMHVTGLAVWGGGLVYFALSPWPRPAGGGRVDDETRRRLAATSRRFSLVGMIFVGAIIASGAFMAYRLIYSIIAVTGTPYGLALLRKILLLAGLLVLAGVNHFYFVPRLERGEGPATLVQRFRWTVWGEVALLFFILVSTGALTTNSPPREPQAIPRPIHQTGVVSGIHYEIDVTPYPAGNLVFDLRLTDAEGRPVSVTPPEMDLTMPEHLMPPYYATMRRTGPGRYEADLILPMSGRWVIYIRTDLDGVPLDDIVLDFRSGASLRDQQREWYVSHWRATRLPLGPVVTVFWTGLVFLAVFAIRQGRRKEEFKPLLVSGGLLLFFSLWQVGSLFVAKGYPTEYQPNPVPRTEETVALGRELYMANCAVCHGPEGRGDGPLRDTMWPPPSRLSWHAPWHADGELYWFITKGVNGTDMPAFEQALTDEERWAIVHFLRTLPREGPIWFPGERTY